MKKKRKRLLAFLLACFMTVGSIPDIVSRAEGNDAVADTETILEETKGSNGSTETVIETDDAIVTVTPEVLPAEEPAETLEDTENPEASIVNVDEVNTTADHPVEAVAEGFASAAKAAEDESFPEEAETADSQLSETAEGKAADSAGSESEEPAETETVSDSDTLSETVTGDDAEAVFDEKQISDSTDEGSVESKDESVAEENAEKENAEAETAEESGESDAETSAEETETRTDLSITLSEGVYIEEPKESYAEGDEISLITFLNKNTLPRSLEIRDADGNAVFWTSEDSLLHVSFVMPNQDVTVFALFSEMTEAENKSLHNGTGSALAHQEAVMEATKQPEALKHAETAVTEDALESQDTTEAMDNASDETDESDTAEEDTETSPVSRILGKAMAAVTGFTGRLKTTFSPICASAAPSDSGYYSMGGQINYAATGYGSGNWTNTFNINSNGTDYFGFCVNPSLYAPADGTYAIEDLTGNERLRKVLFYGYQGQVGGYLESIGVTSPAQQNVITHTALAQAYGDSRWSSGLNATGIRLTNAFLALIDSSPAPTPEQQKVYRLATPNSRQTILFGEGQTLGSILILKDGAVIDDNGSRIEYLAATAPATYLGGRKIQDNTNYNSHEWEDGDFGGAQFTIYEDTGLSNALSIYGGTAKTSQRDEYVASGLIRFVWFTAFTDTRGFTIFGPVDADKDYWIAEGAAPTGFNTNDEMVKVHVEAYSPSDTFPFGLSFAHVVDEVKPARIMIQKNDASGSPIKCAAGKGAVFGLYQTQADAAADTNWPAANAKRMETAETDANGQAKFTTRMLMGETYYVKELRAPVDTEGRIYKKSNAVTAVTTLNPDSTAAVSGYTLAKIANDEEEGYLDLEKKSSNTSISNGNACYTMNGIQYQVYKDAGATQPVAGKVFTLGNYNAATSTAKAVSKLPLPPGKYWVREVESSTIGKNYAYNTKVYGPYTVKSSNTATNPVVVKAEDAPLSDPVGILLKKVDESGNGAILRRVNFADESEQSLR